MLPEVAGDEECFETFKDLFDIVVEKRNGGYKPDAVHPTDLDIEKVSKTKIDPDGKYVLTTRCRTGRSVRGLPLPPACSFEQRRETERVCVKGLNNLEGELKGKYYPLHGSQSMEGKEQLCTESRELCGERRTLHDLVVRKLNRSRTGSFPSSDS